MTADGVLLLGQAGFSEGSLLPSFLAWFSLLPLYCLFRSPSRRFDRIFRTPRPVLHDFRLLLNDELFNKLVAYRVGLGRMFFLVV